MSLFESDLALFFNNFLKDHQRLNVEELSNTVSKSVLVSVCITTYNQVDYIKDCLDGVLRQKTSFNYEILLGDDGSNDGTRELCEQYATKYPDKIRLFKHHRENNIRINGRPTGRFSLINSLYLSNGKYIALCEGDDYWIDDLKLQSQFELLESNNSLSGCYHACKIQYISNNKVRVSKKNKFKELSMDSYLRNRIFITTGSLFFRKSVLVNNSQDFTQLFAYDFILKYLILLEGNIGYLDKVMSVYRKGVEGSWSKNDLTIKRIEKEYIDNLFALFRINEISGYKYNLSSQSKAKLLRKDYTLRLLTKLSTSEKLKLIATIFFDFDFRYLKAILKKNSL